MAKYSRSSKKEVEHEMRKLKKKGPTKRLKNRKQAIAIGLSKARRKGEKVPPPKGGRAKKSK